MSKQQDQTKSFFKKHAKDWHINAEADVYSLVNDRHRAVYKTLGKYPEGARFLDVGCGTGQLAIEASKDGYGATGIDFAEEMIEIAKANGRDANSSAIFEVASVFDYTPDDAFDVVSAMGFIEYISLEQLEEFLTYAYQNLTDKGAISVGSRNRVFNVTTFNAYTEIETKLVAIDSLLEEARLTMASKNMPEYLARIRKFSKSVNHVQHETHPITGIDVATRYQFTPSDLLKRVEDAGFQVTNIFPVNFHAFNPVHHADDAIKLLQRKIAELVSNEYQNDFRFLTNSSSFVLEAVKDR